MPPALDKIQAYIHVCALNVPCLAVCYEKIINFKKNSFPNLFENPILILGYGTWFLRHTKYKG